MTIVLVPEVSIGNLIVLAAGLICFVALLIVLHYRMARFQRIIDVMGCHLRQQLQRENDEPHDSAGKEP